MYADKKLLDLELFHEDAIVELSALDSDLGLETEGAAVEHVAASRRIEDCFGGEGVAAFIEIEQLAVREQHGERARRPGNGAGAIGLSREEIGHLMLQRVAGESVIGCVTVGAADARRCGIAHGLGRTFQVDD